MDIVKDFMERIEALEDKLKGEDRETLEGILFMFDECAKKLFETEERIDEAIEYICEFCLYDEEYKNFNLDLYYYEIPKLMEILKGDSNE